MTALLCFLFGHRWYPWEPAFPIVQWTNGSPPTFTTNGWMTRFCARWHVENRGFDPYDWEPLGGIVGIRPS